jgi:predicted dinucleotide-binding enzyme
MALMKIAFIGHGNVGGALAGQIQKRGHEVAIATREHPAAAIRPSDVVFLAIPFNANESVLEPLAAELAGKILIDCTNPVGAGLAHGLGSKQSGTEIIQALLPSTQVVKAFTIYGYENFENNSFPAYNVKPVMMFCGNDAGAKDVVGKLIAELGWEPLDVGGLEQALHLEHMTLLWVRYVRAGRRSPNLVWAALRR